MSGSPSTSLQRDSDVHEPDEAVPEKAEVIAASSETEAQAVKLLQQVLTL